jgi:outer membrane lipoprotein-sorting protein
MAILFLMCSFFGYAQTAQQLLQDVSAKAAAYQTISAGFTYSLQNTAAKLNDSQTGKLTVKGDKYRLEIARQIILCDGKTVWTLMPDTKEVQINNLSDMEDAITPNKIFSEYYKKFSAKSVSEKTIQNIAYKVIDLEPVDKKEFSNAALTVQKSGLTPYELKLTDKRGTVHTYTLNNFKANAAVNDAVFSFNAGDYKDYEIIDMR